MAFKAHSQTYKFKATQFVCTRFQNQPMDPPEFKDANGMAVEFNMDSSILYIHSPGIQVFHLDPQPFDGGEKDSVLTYKFHGISIKGIKCIITHELFLSEKAPHFASFWIEYPDETYMYYVERIWKWVFKRLPLTRIRYIFQLKYYMAEGLPFDRKDLDKINANTLISLVAQQQALFAALVLHLKLDVVQFEKEAERLYQEKTTSVLSHLYTQFGMTPDVLLPEKDDENASTI